MYISSSALPRSRIRMHMRLAAQSGSFTGKGLLGLVERAICAAANRRSGKAQSPVAKNTLPDKDAFLLGVDLRTGEQVWLSQKDLARHVYSLGSTGCGKTNTQFLLITSDMSAGRTVIVLDLRGDLADRIIRLAASMEHKPDIALIDLGQDDFVAGLNPLSGPGETHSKAFHTLEVVKKHFEGLGVQVEDTLRHCLVALAEAGMSLAEIEPLLTNAGFRSSIVARLSDGGAKAFLERFESLSAERQLAMVLPVLNKVGPFLSSPCLLRTFGSSDGLNLGSFLEARGRVLVVSLAVSRHHSFSHLAGGLLISAIQNAAMARDISGHLNPVRMYIDEFETMASDSFAAIIAEGRRFGLSLCLSHQNLSQISPVLRDCLRNNAGVQLFFQTGALDASSLSAEISGFGSKDEARSVLMAQKVGETVCIKRAENAVPVRTVLADSADAPKDVIKQFRQDALSRIGVPSSNVDADMASRISNGTPAAKPAVRHSRKPLAGKGGE